MGWVGVQPPTHPPTHPAKRKKKEQSLHKKKWRLHDDDDVFRAQLHFNLWPWYAVGDEADARRPKTTKKRKQQQKKHGVATPAPAPQKSIAPAERPRIASMPNRQTKIEKNKKENKQTASANRRRLHRRRGPRRAPPKSSSTQPFRSSKLPEAKRFSFVCLFFCYTLKSAPRGRTR